MSEYPIHCAECGKYLFMRHAMEEDQSKVVCDVCFRKKNPDGYWEYDEFIKWDEKKQLKDEVGK